MLVLGPVPPVPTFDRGRPRIIAANVSTLCRPTPSIPHGAVHMRYRILNILALGRFHSRISSTFTVHERSRSDTDGGAATAAYAYAHGIHPTGLGEPSRRIR